MRDRASPAPTGNREGKFQTERVNSLQFTVKVGNALGCSAGACLRRQVPIRRLTDAEDSAAKKNAVTMIYKPQ